MRLYRPLLLSRVIFPKAVFRISGPQKALYLTFDDGPDPVSTPEVIDILAKYNVRAMFFLNGRNAEMYPRLVGAIKASGHLVGNHGYDHINGWLSATRKYLANVSSGAQLSSDRWFRPPYGRLRYRQYLKLSRSYKIVFWDVMPYDFDQKFGKELSLKVLREKVRAGSIIVLHDTESSSCVSILSAFLEHALGCGYLFKILSDQD